MWRFRWRFDWCFRSQPASNLPRRCCQASPWRFPAAYSSCRRDCYLPVLPPAGNAPLPKSKSKPGVRNLSGMGVYIHISGSGAERHSSRWRWSADCCRSSSPTRRSTCCCSCRRAARRATSPPGRSAQSIFGTFPMQTRPGKNPGRGAIIVAWRISFHPLWLSIRRSVCRSRQCTLPTRRSCGRSASSARFRPYPCRWFPTLPA